MVMTHMYTRAGCFCVAYLVVKTHMYTRAKGYKFFLCCCDHGTDFGVWSRIQEVDLCVFGMQADVAPPASSQPADPILDYSCVNSAVSNQEPVRGRGLLPHGPSQPGKLGILSRPVRLRGLSRHKKLAAMGQNCVAAHYHAGN